MLDFIQDLAFFIIAGAGVGFAVGLTGVGGGSLMTPLLILSGIPEKIAIGTDLLYASITKAGGVLAHTKQKTIEWRIVLLLAAGSLPTAVATSLLLKFFFNGHIDYGPLLARALGYMLILTGAVLFFKKQLEKDNETLRGSSSFVTRHKSMITVSAGLILGVFVTLSSVGAGAFCAVLLLTLYPRLSAIRVIGTDIAHAVPLTFIAGLGHFLLLGNVDFKLLAGLLIGSLPAVYIGARMSNKISNRILQPILATLLVVIGIKFAFF